jgi:hypothetical protein
VVVYEKVYWCQISARWNHDSTPEVVGISIQIWVAIVNCDKITFVCTVDDKVESSAIAGLALSNWPSVRYQVSIKLNDDSDGVRSGVVHANTSLPEEVPLAVRRALL